MTAPPLANQSYDAKLISRVETAVRRGREDRDVEFKRSAEYAYLKKAIVRSSIALSNYKNGGILVIGYDEGSSSGSQMGISDGHLLTYDADDCADLVNKYADPYLDFKMLVVDVEGTKFLCFEFAKSTSLVVAKKSHDEWKLRKGDVLYRLPGKPRSARPEASEHFREMLDWHIKDEAAKLFRLANDVGGQTLGGSVTDAEKFDSELGGL